MTRQRLSRTKAITFSIVWTILLLTALEGGLRIYAHGMWMHGRGLPPPAQRNVYQVLDPSLGYTLKPGYSAKGITINSLGFRGPELTVEKPKGTTRIVALGDSTTFGGSGEECPYPAQMQQLLDSRYGRGKFQVINAGVEGYGVDYALRLFETRIISLSPDIVVTYIGWNDLYSTNPYSPRLPYPGAMDTVVTVESSWKTRLAYALDSLYISKAIKKLLYVYLPLALPVREVSISPHFTTYFQSRLSQLIHTARTAHARPVLLTLPTLVSEKMSETAIRMLHYPQFTRGNRDLFLDFYRRFDDAIRETAQRENVPMIGAGAHFETLNKDAFFFDSLHMHCEGYAEVAKYIVSELQRQGLISTPREASRRGSRER